MKSVLLIAVALPVYAQFAGPAILARGEAPAAMAAPQIEFRPFFEVSGTYNTGLATVALNDEGQLAMASSPGVEVAWGATGAHSWRHTRVGLDYRGSMSHYTRQTYYDSGTQSLMFSLNQQLSRHVTFNAGETAGMFSRSFGQVGLSPAVAFDPVSTNIPTTDFFDNRTIYSTSHADLVYQRTSRLSFSFGGDGFIVRRRSKALSSVVGESARGDVAYRVSRKSTIGAAYDYSHFTFTRYFGGTDVHSAVLAYSAALSRWTEVSAYAGEARVELKTIQSAPVDPAIAALLGITSVAQVYHRISYVPDFGVRLSRTVKTGVFYVWAGHGVTPGNGLFLTSYSSTVSGGYTYTGRRRWSFSTVVDYSRNTAIGNVSGEYGGVGGRAAVTRQIARSMHVTMSYSARRYNSPDYASYNRLISEARLGFGFAPGDVPLRIW